jgi:hypothetical protein
MIRVSKGTIVFCEPARGVVRRVLVGVGLKPSTEGSGNTIYEFSRSEVIDVALPLGARLHHFRRHLVPALEFEPRIFRILDRLRLRGLVLAAIRSVDQTLGRVVGTKCDALLERASVAGLTSVGLTEAHRSFDGN